LQYPRELSGDEGPNDARCVVWAIIGTYFYFYF
jgi:hypothetical protein